MYVIGELISVSGGSFMLVAHLNASPTGVPFIMCSEQNCVN